MYNDNLSSMYMWIFDCVEKGQLYTFGDGRHAKLGLDHECYSNQYFPQRSKRFSKFIVTQVSPLGVHVHQVHQGFGIMCRSSGLHVHVKVIRGTCSCEGHQGYIQFMWGTSGVHVHWKFIGCSCEGYQVEIHTYIHWKFIRCKSCFEVHQIHGKLTFIRVQEIFERFARALSLWIFLTTSELLA